MALRIMPLTRRGCTHSNVEAGASSGGSGLGSPTYSGARGNIQFTTVKSIADPAFESLVSVVLVVALLAFMLIKREDLRNRLMRLWGHGSVTSLTRAQDAAFIIIAGRG